MPMFRITFIDSTGHRQLLGFGKVRTSRYIRLLPLHFITVRTTHSCTPS